MNMSKDTKNKTLGKFLQLDFSRISDRLAKEICDKAGLSMEVNPAKLGLEDQKRLLAAIGAVKIMAPPTDCLSPIGANLIKKGLRNVLDDVRPEFYAPPVTRDPKVHSGNPFLIEVGIVYGGDLPKDSQVQILRFANRVPLLYQQGRALSPKRSRTPTGGATGWSSAAAPAYRSDRPSYWSTSLPPRFRSPPRPRRPSPTFRSCRRRSSWR